MLAAAVLAAAAVAFSCSVLAACGSAPRGDADATASSDDDLGDLSAGVLARGTSPLGRRYEIAVASRPAQEGAPAGGSPDVCLAVTYGRRHGHVCGGALEGTQMEVLPAISDREVVVIALLKPSVARISARITGGTGASGSARAYTVSGVHLARLVLPLRSSPDAAGPQGPALQVRALDRSGRVVDTEALGAGPPVPAR